MTKPQRARWFRLKIKILVRHRKITAEAKLLWLVLESYASMDGTSCHPKIATLMRDTGKGRKWVEKYLRELEQKHKLIRIGKLKTPAGWCVNSYTIFYPVTLLAGETSHTPKLDRHPYPQKGPTIGYQLIGPTPTPSVEDEPAGPVIIPFKAQRIA